MNQMWCCLSTYSKSKQHSPCGWRANVQNNIGNKNFKMYKYIDNPSGSLTIVALILRCLMINLFVHNRKAGEVATKTEVRVVVTLLYILHVWFLFKCAKMAKQYTLLVKLIQEHPPPPPLQKSPKILEMLLQ